MTAGEYRVPYLPLGSLLGMEELAAITRVIESGETLSCGTERDLFEQEFAAYTGAAHAVSVTNCTVALELATYLLELQAGDEVIAATQTYQANVTPLLASDVTVKFCDIDPGTLNVSPDAFERLITNRTKALFLVHLGGFPADMAPIMEIANRHGVRVVEDCAHALGTRYRGQSPGTFGFGCWSFQSYKNMTTLGEGGMVTVSDPDHARVLSRITAIEPDADFSPMSQSPFAGLSEPADEIERHAKNAYTEQCLALRHPGTNATLAEPAAAVGRVQLAKLDFFVGRRREIAYRLDEGLGDLPGLRLQPRFDGVESSHHLYTFFITPEAGIDRDELARRLDADGIQVQLRYFPVHLLPEWRRLGHGLGECPVAERIWFREQMNLPIYPQLADWQVDFMIESVKAAWTGLRR